MSKRIKVCVISIQSTFCILLAAIVFLAGMKIRGVGEYQRMISLGDKYLEELDYENAILSYRKAIEISDKRTAGYVKLAVAYMNTGKYNAAEEILRKGVKKTGKNDRFEELQIIAEEYQSPEKIMEREKETLHAYLKDTLIPQKGLAELGPVQGIMHSFRDPWYDNKGIISAVTEDLDQDGKLELLVLSVRDSLTEMIDNQTFKGYQMWMEVYEITEEGIVLSDEMHLQQYLENEPEIEISDFRENQWQEINFHVTLKAGVGEEYICIEKSELGSLFADGSSRNYWIIEYMDEKIQYVSSFTQTSGGSIDFQYTEYQFENGVVTGQDILYADNIALSKPGRYATYEEAVQGFFAKYGVEASFVSQNESVLIQRESMEPILDYGVYLIDNNINVTDTTVETMGILEMRAVDYTDIRES